jgi:hypothetical protein
MASLIWLGGLYPMQNSVERHKSQPKCYNFDDDIRDEFDTKSNEPLLAIIAKGNIIEGVEAKT